MVHRNLQPERYHGYRGREAEADFLGEVDVRDSKFQEELGRVAKDARGYTPYRQAVELAKRFQPGGDSKNPRKGFLRDLRLAVAERLNLTTDEELERIGAYTAVGTPLDIFHGVDGFISATERGNQEKIVTMDVTLRKGKIDEGGKADIIIGEITSPDEDEDAYLAQVDSIADEIVSKLKKMN